MKTTKILVLVLVSVLAVSFAACSNNTAPSSSATTPPQNSSQTPETLPASTGELPSSENSTSDDVPDNEKLKKMFIDPLGSAIGSSWESPEEIDPDDVLVTFEIKVLNDSTADEYFGEDANLYFPCEVAEEYAEQYFGMSQEMLRMAEAYDSESQKYVVIAGLGGGLDIDITGGNRNGNRLEILYISFDVEGLNDKNGILTVQINSDESYQYISNVLSPAEWSPIADLTEKVNQAPGGDESFGLQMLYSQLSYIARGETRTPYTGFASPNEISSSELYNFFLAMAQDDVDKYLSADDNKYHIPIEAIKNTLDSYFSGYTFDPKQIVREPEGTCTYSEEAQEIIDDNFVGYGGPAWIEVDNAEVQANGEIIVSAHGIDMDGNAVDRTETITVTLTASGYQFKSYQIADTN